MYCLWCREPIMFKDNQWKTIPKGNIGCDERPMEDENGSYTHEPYEPSIYEDLEG